MPAARRRSMYEDSARSEPLTSAPSCRQTSASPLIPAPPIAMKWSLRPSISAIHGPQHLAGDSVGGVGPGEPAGGDPHIPQAVLVAEQLGDRGAQPVPGELTIRNHDGRSAFGHPASVGRLVVGS